ncbi:MAG: peptidoglycan-binding protein [Gammaproteobacteria bacterium]|nr:peptidoglycan-binding protein [Gammaproteobacteria bacterium]
MKRSMTVKKRWQLRGLAVLALWTLTHMLSATLAAQTRDDAQQLVDKAERTLHAFQDDPQMDWFRENLRHARGVLIVPDLLRAGFIFGGAGGQGVLLGRARAGNLWSMPAFYDIGSVSFGLQIGAEVAEVMLLIMTERGLHAIFSTDFKLGAEVSVALGPTGVAAKAATADVLAYSRAQGAFAGLTLEGAIVAPKDDWNAAYYGKTVKPIQIIKAHAVSNEGAERLTQALRGPSSDTSPALQSASTAYDLSTIQTELKRRGYDPGVADGQMGPATSQAIRQYQMQRGLPVTGQPSLALQRELSGE